NSYHILMVTTQLSRNIEALCPEIRDEICMAFDDISDLSGNEWKTVSAASSMKQVVCRTTNRVFVGLPLCEPSHGLPFLCLEHIAARLFTSVSQSNQHERKLLRPIIAERLRYLNESGKEWANKPNDFLSWMMEEAEDLWTVKLLTARMMFINFASIHVGPDSFTQVLFQLAANPRYVQPLREEVEAIVEKEGWSKAALGGMRKVDSFVKECQRLIGVNSVGLSRKAMKGFTFADGTFIPKGTTVVTAIQSIHHDEMFYENARAFKPFRFAELHEEDGEGVESQFTSTATEFLAFGHGRHTCTGRFFAASVLKSMLAYVVVTYDVKLADNTTRTRTLNFATILTPDPSVKVMFRRRVD
ncbi:cytochrome P450, partial [Butyriboletus roseoflavus]